MRTNISLPRRLFVLDVTSLLKRWDMLGVAPLPLTEPPSLNMNIIILVIAGILGGGLKRGGHYLEDHPI